LSPWRPTLRPVASSDKALAALADAWLTHWERCDRCCRLEWNGPDLERCCKHGARLYSQWSAAGIRSAPTST
jgi:hypothetical protein